MVVALSPCHEQVYRHPPGSNTNPNLFWLTSVCVGRAGEARFHKNRVTTYTNLFRTMDVMIAVILPDARVVTYFVSNGHSVCFGSLSRFFFSKRPAEIKPRTK